MKTLPPQRLLDFYWADIETQLKSIFYGIVFSPVMEIIKKASPQGKNVGTLMNAASPYGSLMMAIVSGRVQYTEGVFSGDFSVAISKDLRAMGGSFDHRSEVYRIEPGRVPASIRAAAANYQTTAKGAHDAVLRKLNDIQEHLDEIVDSVDVDADETLKRIDAGFKKAAHAMEVQPVLKPEARKALAEDYNKNMKIYVKDFSQQSVKALRAAVEDNAMEGFRFDKLTDSIRHRYGVTANKARFLARQETSLFMAKYRKQRFEQAGVRKYRWSTAHDERVRDSHKHLDGRVFTYDSPPITDRATGARNNPGEDFNCRCVDIPILESDATYV